MREVKALHMMKYGKTAGVDGIAVDFFKKCEDSVVDWIARLCLYAQGEVPDDWENACIEPLNVKACLNY